MPKYCSVPNCRNDSGTGGDRRSFYKFPLSDPARLQLWLRNMGRESWVPSRHQYICHEHFTPSCFKVRWGIRYLESDAVPTVFQGAEKRRAADHSEDECKRLRDDQSLETSGDGTAAVDGVEVENTLHTVHLYEITVDASQQGEAVLMDLSHAGEPAASLQEDASMASSVDGPDGEDSFPLAVFHDVSGLDGGENTEVVVMSEGQDELVNELTAAFLSHGSGLLMNESPLSHTEAAVASLHVQDLPCGAEELGQRRTQVIAYFKTVPDVLPTEPSPRFAFSPDTVLSSALSATPITSTVPIVSKHLPPSPASLVLTVERLDADNVEGDDGELEEEDGEQLEQQLEEHCYHKNSLSKEQLEAIVSELQKKVKVLQQRHRRHLEKLLGLENTVSQLRQNNLLNEERLQLLERAYIQTSGGVSEACETVAIIYEEDNAAFLYTPLSNVAL
ncbi:THAP domain-containing protein 5-like [Genypterus blacodes]|uniref:THAP domain-containing protein 5-like n=1 Tax=Genypterus blacodes TaxID=154954 RepID=UPI003F75C828